MRICSKVMNLFVVLFMTSVALCDDSRVDDSNVVHSNQTITSQADVTFQKSQDELKDDVDDDERSRGLPEDLINTALYSIGVAALGKKTTDRIAPVVQGIRGHLANVVDVKDGRIVLGSGTSSSTSTTTTTTTTTPKPNKKTDPQQQQIQGNASSSFRSCTTPSGGSGRCRELTSCPSLLISLSVLRQSICFQSLFTPGVCCPEKTSSSGNIIENIFNQLVSNQQQQHATTTAVPKPIAETFRPTPITTRPRPIVTAPRPVISGRCGQASAASLRIVGGDLSRPGSWPWMAAIFLRGPKGVEFWCGGSLINERYVLTAAHCTRDSKQKSFSASQYYVRLGEYDLRDSFSSQSIENFEVTRIKVHPDFSGYGFYNDVALFQLDRPVTYTDYVQPVCLPTRQQDKQRTFVGETPTVIGWGTTSYGGRESTLLRQVQLPVWRNEDCNKAYFQPITEVFLCAGFADGGKDACQGDSGGPLLLEENGSWMQIGLVSFGNKCAERGFPGVYTRITHFIDWIQSNSNSVF